MEYEKVTHTFEPVYNKDSRILILGSFPSVKSRENNFYYGHPQNRFWKVMASILEEDIPVTIEEKKSMLLKHNIAIWDVIASCSIQGSSDNSIKDVVPNDIKAVVDNSAIERIYANGGKAYELYHRYVEKYSGIKAVKLPSTSPANAAWNLEKLISAWSKLIKLNEVNS